MAQLVSVINGINCCNGTYGAQYQVLSIVLYPDPAFVKHVLMVKQLLWRVRFSKYFIS